MSSFVELADGSVALYDVECVGSTELAIQINFEGERMWIPRSQIQDFDEDFTYLEIPEWLAQEKGII